MLEIHEELIMQLCISLNIDYEETKIASLVKQLQTVTGRLTVCYWAIGHSKFWG